MLIVYISNNKFLIIYILIRNYYNNNKKIYRIWLRKDEDIFALYDTILMILSCTRIKEYIKKIKWCDVDILCSIYTLLDTVLYSIIFVFQQVKIVIYKQFPIIMFLIKMLQFFIYYFIHAFISLIISLITIVCICFFFL